MDVLQANAIDFARQIDELRCFLVEPKTKVSLVSARCHASYRRPTS